jgi:copper(I)-binding protein
MNCGCRIFGVGLLLGLLSLPALGLEPALVIERQWIRQGPPGAMLGGYMQITNPGSERRIIQSVESDRFEHVGIHRTLAENGIARMRPVDTIVLPPGATCSLEPGGYHLMLSGPRDQVRLGDEIRLRFKFDDGEEQSFTIPVRRAAP